MCEVLILLDTFLHGQIWKDMEIFNILFTFSGWNDWTLLFIYFSYVVQFHNYNLLGHIAAWKESATLSVRHFMVQWLDQTK